MVSSLDMLDTLLLDNAHSQFNTFLVSLVHSWFLWSEVIYVDASTGLSLSLVIL